MPGGASKGEFGAAVASAGDVNGDGYDDLLVGAFRVTDPDSAEGRAYLYLGGPGGLSTTPAWVVEGNQYNAEFGYHLESAGDVNHDGYADVILSAVTYSPPGLPGAGRGYLFLGGPHGLATTPAWTFDGDQADGRMGDAVAGLGDINGDGFSDFGMGGLYHDNAWVDSGRALVFYGGADCFPAAVTDEPKRSLELDVVSANPSRGRTVFGYYLPAGQHVRIEMHDIAGRKIGDLVDGFEPGGEHSVSWDGARADGSRLASGIYFVRLEGQDGARSTRVAILR